MAVISDAGLVKSAFRKPYGATTTMTFMNTSNKIRVALADDHIILREGLAELINAQADMVVVDEANNGVEAIDLAKRHKPDVFLLDIHMPQMTGLQAIEKIKQASPQTKILIVSGYYDEDLLISTLSAGARGYIQKNSSEDMLIEGVRQVQSGNWVLHQTVFPAIQKDKACHVAAISRSGAARLPQDDPNNPYAGMLTPRELEVVGLLVKGMSNKEISKALFVSERTIHTHLSNIFEKLNVTSRLEVVLIAMKNSLV